MNDIEAHNREIHDNINNWNNKPLLRELYKEFHQFIAAQLANSSMGAVVELGSGVADIREVIPHCIRTDLFSNPWVDQTENAYQLSFNNNTVSNLILFDVFHHLRFPGAALNEFQRVLASNGRVIIFEPTISLLGWLVYGALHKEPIAYNDKINWSAPLNWKFSDIDYYAAQGNATRIFINHEIDVSHFGWKIVCVEQMSAFSYIASGGYSKPQLYPLSALPFMRKIDKFLDKFPRLFSTRLLIVLEKCDN